MEQNEVEKQAKALNLNKCLDIVSQAYEINWNKACKDLGRADRCMLPDNMASSIQATQKEGTDNCIKLYGN